MPRIVRPLFFILVLSCCLGPQLKAQEDDETTSPFNIFNREKDTNAVARIAAEQAEREARLMQEEATQRRTKELLRAKENMLLERRQADPSFLLRQVLNTIDLIHKDAKEASKDNQDRIRRLREERAKVKRRDRSTSGSG